MEKLGLFVLGHLIDILLVAVPGTCLLLMWLDFKRKRYRRNQPHNLGFCKKCGYNLHANESGRCPECGMPVPK